MLELSGLQILLLRFTNTAKECSVRDCCMWALTLPTACSTVRHTQQAEKMHFAILFTF